MRVHILVSPARSSNEYKKKKKNMSSMRIYSMLYDNDSRRGKVIFERLRDRVRCTAFSFSDPRGPINSIIIKICVYY